MTDGRLTRPRHREQHFAPFALQVVVDPEAATAYVHRHVNGHRRIEVRVGERQGGSVALLEGYAIA
jgi:hypothetical protein